MKRFLLAAFALAALWFVPTLASATHIFDFVPTADCEGWAVDFKVEYLQNTSTADLAYSVVLGDANGAEVVRFEDTMAIGADGHWTGYYNLSDIWGVDLCGDYTAVFLFELTPHDGSKVDTHTGEVSFNCDCEDEEYGCTYTPGYWKNHEEMWPLSSVLVGANELTQTEAMAVLWTPVRGDATIILAYHLIAATLNVANGADPSIQSAIDAANSLLAQYELGSRPGRNIKQELLAVKDDLMVYNELPCNGDDSPCDPAEKSLEAMEEQVEWDSFKAMFR